MKNNIKTYTNKFGNKIAEEYNSNNKLIKRTTCMPDNEIITLIYEYNKNEKLVKRIFYENNKINRIDEYYPDKKTSEYSPDKSTVYNSNGTVGHISTNDNQAFYDSNGILECINEHNEDGTKRIFYNFDGTVNYSEFFDSYIHDYEEYCEINLTKKIFYYPNGTVKSIIEYRIVETITDYNPDGTIKN